MKRREREFKTTAPPSPKKRRIQQEKGTYQEERQRTLDLTWEQVVDALKKLESFISTYRKSKKKSPWKTEEKMGVFDEIYELCTNPDANFFQKKLYNRYTVYLTDYLTNRLLTELNYKNEQEGYSMTILQRVVEVWKDYKNIFVKFCAKLLKYLDRYFVVNENLLGLQLKGQEIFRDTVFKDLSNTLQSIILQEFQADRESTGGGRLNRHLIKEALTMFLDMGLDDQYQETRLYDDLIESKLADQTHEHFRKIANGWINKLTMTDYLKRAEKKILDEITRLQSIFSEIPKTRSRLTKICQEELLSSRVNDLLHIPGSSVVELIERKEYKDLERLGRLMQMIEGGLKPVAEILKDYVIKKGIEIYRRHHSNCLAKNSFGDMVRYLNQNYVEDVFQLYQYFEKVVNEPFKSQVVFSKALGDGFRMILKNEFYRASAPLVRLKSSQLFAFYCDDIVRNMRMSGDELEKKVDHVINLISFFEDRDMFLEEYRIQFSKRLLLTQYNEDLEKMILQKFKLERGAISEVYKLEKMLLDKIVAIDVNIKFKEYLNNPNFVIKDEDEHDEGKESKNNNNNNNNKDTIIIEEEEEEEETDPSKKKKKKKKKKKTSSSVAVKNRNKMNFDLQVQILTMNIWPIQTSGETLIPAPDFIEGQNIFSKFYRNMYNNNRVLKWCYSRSNCRVLGRFIKGDKIFSVTMFQANILLLFNSSECLSIKQIMENTGLVGSGFNVNLISLCNRRCQLLLRKKDVINKRKKRSMMKSPPELNSDDVVEKRSLRRPPPSMIPEEIEEVEVEDDVAISPAKRWYEQDSSLMVVNSGFWSRSARIKVKLPRVTAKETRITQKKVESDRTMSIDAAIVRIMKNRKSMRFKELVNETTNQLSSRFLPLPKYVKKRIESLMDREYLKRNDNDKSLIHYLA